MDHATEENKSRELVWHYTNAAGLLGIMNSNALWASDVRFMNDSQELHFGRSLLREAIKEVAQEMGGAAGESGQAGPGFPLICVEQNLADPWPEYEETYPDPEAFAVSFCRDGDPAYVSLMTRLTELTPPPIATLAQVVAHIETVAGPALI